MDMMMMMIITLRFGIGIRDSRDGEGVDFILLGSHASYSCKLLPALWKKVSPTFSGPNLVSEVCCSALFGRDWLLHSDKVFYLFTFFVCFLYHGNVKHLT
jgi:hypothetical protein